MFVKKKRWKMISMGGNCWPRKLLKRQFGLSKKNNYKSCPFDLCITPFTSLCSILENNFNNFFDGLEIVNTDYNAEGDRTTAGPGFKVIKNKAGMIFNHESPSHSHLFREGKNDDFFYTKNNFKQLKIRYMKRITNFKNILKKNKNIIFVYNDPLFDENIIKNLIYKHYGFKYIRFRSVIFV
jgi:hypothetical protein